MSLTLCCPCEADTRALGRRLASLLRAGDVVLLAGDLGSGKTVFASGIAEGLGVAEPVVSPSFILARRYEGLMGLVHADLYRLGSSAEVDDLDWPLSASFGVATFPDDAVQADEVLRLARAACRTAKAAGRNAVEAAGTWGVDLDLDGLDS